ncbi:hypothetical protein BaRGS_00013939 [Batillaria attramentaria]|uniref:Uncharacterized protein n=1 Tax=Batillaria attramentaria TaxID=370345 RepID=A0ABD0L625_9CAEN
MTRHLQVSALLPSPPLPLLAVCPHSCPCLHSVPSFTGHCHSGNHQANCPVTGRLQSYIVTVTRIPHSNLTSASVHTTIFTEAKKEISKCCQVFIDAPCKSSQLVGERHTLTSVRDTGMRQA